MHVIRKVVGGSPGRLTRFHTERNELIPASEFKHLPGAVVTKLATLVTGRRPDRPWWPTPVIPVIEDFLTDNARVIEFGSGSSTIWLAKRSAAVISMESSPEWFERVSARLADQGLNNVELHLAQGSAYSNIAQFAPPGGFDLAIVDGDYRWRCVSAVLPLMRRGSILYLDNSDADKDCKFYEQPGMARVAQGIMERYCIDNPHSYVQRFRGFISGEVHAGEGMLLRVNF